MRARNSPAPAGTAFHRRTSLIDPMGPPSALAPLSDTAITRVLSHSPSWRMKSNTRPIWASACERNPAKHSMNRALTLWSSGANVSHAGTQSGRADVASPAGTDP